MLNRIGSFKLVDSNTYPLKGTSGWFLHLASIVAGLREFVCFQDKKTSKVYIEEVSGGSLSFIDDDSLAYDLAKFLEDKGVTSFKRWSN